MTTIEKPTVPTPANMAENVPSLNRGDILPEPTETDAFDRPVLGQVAMTREEYAENQDNTEVAQVTDPALFDRTAEANRATLSRDTEDDKVRDELFAGFTIHDSTQPEVSFDEAHDELPEDLKDELGEPDSDEVQNQ